MNIILIGYRGTGKSVVGQQLADRLQMPCISMDNRIIEKAGMSVPEIVAQSGWPGFRDMETAVARELAERDNIIIDCGGGVIERPENIDALKTGGTIIWLKASVDVIVSRICTDTQRPALTDGKTFTEEVAEVLERRTPLYQAAAHHEINTDPLTPETIADRIIRLCR
ncbi:MAG: shikimate kinase [Thermodesulfobacteriota bacterium]|nr:shikimate kinase [Thermodesulfobacteriota bacterium]